MEKKIPVEEIDPEVYKMLISKGLFPLRAVVESLPHHWNFGTLLFYMMDEDGNYLGTTNDTIHVELPKQQEHKTTFSVKFDFKTND